MMITRKIQTILIDFAEKFPVIIVTGPRQSGKTTLCKMAFPQMDYVSLEIPDTREFAVKDPRGFLAEYPDFNQIHSISQSLAGRTALLTLLPFTYEEQQDISEQPRDLFEVLHTGGYPAIYDRNLAPREWFQGYIGSYLERDVRNLLNVTDLISFHTFLGLTAGRTSQLLNLSQLGSDCGITHNTAKETIVSDHFRSLRKFKTVMQNSESDPLIRSILVFGGLEKQARTDAIILPWNKVQDLEWT